MIRVGLAAAFAGLLGAGPAVADTARGVVFEDRNGNGTRDSGESGIADVRVSNGDDVVLTGADGAYEIDVDGDAIVFITKPSGYGTPVNADQIPQFYYLHRPSGSPAGLRYAGIAPTGPLPERIDFPLLRRAENASFDAILFADPQPQTEVELDYIRDDVVTGLIGTDAAFGMTMGDIMFDDMSLFPRYNRIISQIGIPWYNVPGNHEMNLKAADDAHSLETFSRFFGPPYYAFEYGEALFVVLDNIEYQGNGASDPGDVRGSGGYIANLGKRQLGWLEEELSHVAEDRLVFLAMHSPLATYVSPDGEGVNTQDRRALFKLLTGRPNLYAVAGHTHTTEHLYFGPEDGFRGPGKLHHHVLTTVSGSWWSGPFDEDGIAVSPQRDGTPNGYHILSVDGADLTVRYQGAGERADYQMRIQYDVAHHGLRAGGVRDFRQGELFDSRMTADQVPAAEILVNVFDGGPNTRVTFSIDRGPETPLTQVFRRDLYTNELMIRNADVKKSWVEPMPSSHIYSADLPDDLAPGTYTVSVRAVDEFGQVHHGHSVLEITGG